MSGSVVTNLLEKRVKIYRTAQGERYLGQEGVVVAVSRDSHNLRVTIAIDKTGELYEDDARCFSVAGAAYPYPTV